MLRPRLVRSLLLSEIAGARRSAVERAAASAGAARREVENLRRRALSVALLAGAGIVILLVTNPRPADVLAFGGEGSVFAVAVLVVAGFVGFRLGQWQKLGAVARALEELPAEAGEDDEP